MAKDLENMTKIIVLNKVDGQGKIGIIDDYLINMKPFERSLKIGVNHEVTLEEFITFLKENVCEWTNEEKKKLDYSIAKLVIRLEKFNILTPNKIYIIKTSGKEEWNSAYTRGNIIFLPEKKIANYDYKELFELLAHEFFHVYSRINKRNRNRLYELLGFKLIESSLIPKKIKELTIVNPDALQSVYTEVKFKNKIVKVIPLIMIKNENVDDTKDIFHSLKIKLFILEDEKIIDAEEIDDYIEKISVNTNNIQHPEETLAENFTYLLVGKKDIPNNDILEEVREILRT